MPPQIYNTHAHEINKKKVLFIYYMLHINTDIIIIRV